jgi:hypothetical protein
MQPVIAHQKTVDEHAPIGAAQPNGAHKKTSCGIAEGRFFAAPAPGCCND